MTEKERFEKRRSHTGHFIEKVDKGIRLKKNQQKKQERLMQSQHDYVFLQYLPIVFYWARKNHDISIIDLNMLLYMYPLNPFTPTQFKQLRLDIGATDWYMWDRMKGDGWFIRISGKFGLKHYYKFSNKALMLVKRMHRMCMLEEKIPYSRQRNVVAASKDKKHVAMMDVIKEFNQKVMDKSYLQN
jgi:hypothetical protein